MRFRCGLNSFDYVLSNKQVWHDRGRFCMSSRRVIPSRFLVCLSQFFSLELLVSCFCIFGQGPFVLSFFLVLLVDIGVGGKIIPYSCHAMLSYLILPWFDGRGVCGTSEKTLNFCLQGATGKVCSQWPTKTLHTSCANVPVWIALGSGVCSWRSNHILSLYHIFLVFGWTVDFWSSLFLFGEV